MRIVYFSPHPTHDIVSDVGYSTHQREMIHAMRQLGHEVIPVIIGGATAEDLPAETIRQGSSKKRQLLKAVIPPILWRTVKDFMWTRHDKNVAGPALERALLEHKPDLVYERSEYSLELGPAISRKHGIRHILEVNAPCVEEWKEFEGGSLLTWNAEKIEKRKLQNAAGLCPVSSALADHVVEHYGVERQRVKFIQNAIDPQKIHIDRDQVESLRQSLGLNGKQVIGFVGSILEYHGIGDLLNAFEKLHSNFENARVLIVGSGSSLEAMKNLSSKLGVQDKVIFTGRVPHDDVFNYIELMNICVSPKHSWYGSPIKLFEYGAMGKAVVAPNSANIQDLIENKIDGLLFSSGKLAGALEYLLKNPDQIELMGERIKGKVLSEHTWLKNAEHVIEFAKSIAPR